MPELKLIHDYSGGLYYATDPNWVAGYGPTDEDEDTEQQLALVFQAMDMLEATGEEEFEDYPLLVEASIAPLNPNEEVLRECMGSLGMDELPTDPAAKIEVVGSYYGYGVPVTHTLTDAIDDGQDVLEGFTARDLKIVKKNATFGTVAAQQGKGAEIEYPQFATDEAAKLYCERLMNRAPALFGLVGFTLDQPVNLAGESGWSHLRSMTYGTSPYWAR